MFVKPFHVGCEQPKLPESEVKRASRQFEIEEYPSIHLSSYDSHPSAPAAPIAKIYGHQTHEAEEEDLQMLKLQVHFLAG